MADRGERHVSNPFFAAEGEPVLTYEVSCPFCGREITILVPESLSGKGCQDTGCPKCYVFRMTPVCDEQVIDHQARRITRKKLAHNELLLRQEVMGAYHPYPLFSLYPLVEGEGPEARRQRLLGYAMEKCDGLMAEEPAEKEALLQRLLAHSLQLNALCPEVVRLYASADTDRRKEIETVLDAVTAGTTGEMLMERLGKETQTASRLATEPVRQPDLTLRQRAAGNTVPSATLSSEPPAAAPKFCPECGGKVQPGNKFCPECGAKL